VLEIRIVSITFHFWHYVWYYFWYYFRVLRAQLIVSLAT